MDGTDTVIHFVDAIGDAISLPEATYISSDTLHIAADILTRPTIDDSLCEHAQDAYCCTITPQVGQPSIEFQINHLELLVRQSPIDGAVQIVVHTSLRPRMQTFANNLPTAGHYRQRQIYDTPRHKCFRFHMASNVYCTVDRCSSYAQNQQRYRH